MSNYLNIKNIARIAILGSLGAVLMLIDFPIFVAPSFYKLDLSDLPCLIGGFAMGVVPAFFIQVVKILVKLLFKPTSSAFVGEIASFIISCSYCMVASFIYQINKSKKGAIKAMVISSLAACIIACICNYFFIIPAYVKLYNMPLEAIIAMGNAIFSVINDKLSFVLFCVLPFNVIKVVIIDILSLCLYKRVSRLLK